MKLQSLTPIGISLTLVVGYTGEPAIAQLQRHPSVEQARSAVEDQLLPLLPEIQELDTYRDQRTGEERTRMQDFNQVWAPISPNTAPFLGEWRGTSRGVDFTIAIYPSDSTSGRVCVFQYTENDNRYLFGLGFLQDDQLNVTGNGFITSFRRVPVEDGNFIAAVTALPNNEILVGQPAAFPEPLQDPASFLPSGRQRDVFLLNFNTTGCTTTEPTSRMRALRNYPLNSYSTLQDVTFRFDGAYVSDSPTSRSIEAYWVVENWSNESFGFYPRNAEVVTATGEQIDGVRMYLDTTDALVIPGGLTTGRVTIPRRVSELGGLYLVIPEATLGGREFRLPLR